MSRPGHGGTSDVSTELCVHCLSWWRQRKSRDIRHGGEDAFPRSRAASVDTPCCTCAALRRGRSRSGAIGGELIRSRQRFLRRAFIYQVVVEPGGCEGQRGGVIFQSKTKELKIKKIPRRATHTQRLEEALRCAHVLIITHTHSGCRPARASVGQVLSAQEAVGPRSACRNAPGAWARAKSGEGDRTPRRK